MKKFKFLLVFALVLTMISTVVFAADPAVVEGAVNNEIIYAGTGALDISVVANDNYETDSPAAYIEFEADKWTVSDVTTAVSGANALVNEKDGRPTMALLNVATLTKGDKIIAAKFTPIDGVNVIGSIFKIYTYWSDAVTYDEVVTDNVVYTVKANTPVSKTYKVTFTNYSENDTTVNENAEIILPTAPTVGENKVFNGWNDGEKTYAAGAKYTVTKDVTFTADITTVPQPTKAETKVESEKVRDLTYDADKTSHFFEGIYSVTPNDEKIATFGVNVKSKADASKTKTYTKDLTVEGGAKIVLRLALINDDVEILNDLTGEVFYTAE